MAKSYSKGANRTNHGGSGYGSIGVGVGSKARADLRGLWRRSPQKRTPDRPDLPAHVRHALGVAKGHMAAEPSRKKVQAEAAARHANDVPHGHKRVTKRDPVTHELHTLDLPIPGNDFPKLMRLLFQRRSGFELFAFTCPLAPKLQPWQFEFLATGRYQPPEEESDETGTG